MSPIKQLYDYVVIGGGSGGLASARRAAAKYGVSVALVESSGRLGGTCVNVGCVPKKVMWNASSVGEAIRDARYYGFDVPKENPTLAWSVLKERRDAYVKRLNGIYSRNLEKDSVKYVPGSASLVDATTVQVKEGDTVKLLSANKILIATGSHPAIPQDIPGAELGITSDDFFDLKEQPKKVAIVGAGYIAVELSGIFQSLGTQVTLFTRKNSILRSFDTIIGDTVLKEMVETGVRHIGESNVTQLQRHPSGHLHVEYKFKSPDNGSTVTGEDTFDLLLWAIGRSPNIKSLNLDAVGVAKDKNGHIISDDYQNTNVEGLYALGDVCGKAQLTPVAIAAGRKLSARLFGPEEYRDSKLDYTNIPSVIFSHPPSGSVGLSEVDAREKYGDDNIRIYTARFNNMYNALTDHKPPTAFKLIVAGEEERVVGLHIVGRGSDEILQGFAVAIKMGARKQDLDACVAIHPTSAEELVTLV